MVTVAMMWLNIMIGMVPRCGLLRSGVQNAPGLLQRWEQWIVWIDSLSFREISDRGALMSAERRMTSRLSTQVLMITLQLPIVTSLLTFCWLSFSGSIWVGQRHCWPRSGRGDGFHLPFLGDNFHCTMSKDVDKIFGGVKPTTCALNHFPSLLLK